MVNWDVCFGGTNLFAPYAMDFIPTINLYPRLYSIVITSYFLLFLCFICDTFLCYDISLFSEPLISNK